MREVFGDVSIGFLDSGIFCIVLSYMPEADNYISHLVTDLAPLVFQIAYLDYILIIYSAFLDTTTVIYLTHLTKFKP